MTEPAIDDDDLRALGRRARERLRGRASEWEHVALGERDPDAVMRERIAAGDDREAAELAREVFRPFDEVEHQALLDALLAGRASESGEQSVPAAGATGAGREPAANDGRHAWWLVLAAAAAVLLGWWLWPRPVETPGIAVAPLPAYELVTDGGLTELRSEPTAPPVVSRYRQNTPFVWVMRPTVSVADEVSVRGFAIDGATTRVLPLDERVRVSPSGSVRIEGTIAELGLPPGTWTIVLVVGRAEALPLEPPADAPVATEGRWATARFGIRIEP